MFPASNINTHKKNPQKCACRVSRLDTLSSPPSIHRGPCSSEPSSQKKRYKCQMKLAFGGNRSLLLKVERKRLSIVDRCNTCLIWTCVRPLKQKTKNGISTWTGKEQHWEALLCFVVGVNELSMRMQTEREYIWLQLSNRVVDFNWDCFVFFSIVYPWDLRTDNGALFSRNSRRHCIEEKKTADYIFS